MEEQTDKVSGVDKKSAQRIVELKAEVFDLLYSQEGIQQQINQHIKPLQDRINQIEQTKQGKLQEIIKLQE